MDTVDVCEKWMNLFLRVRIALVTRVRISMFVLVSVIMESDIEEKECFSNE